MKLTMLDLLETNLLQLQKKKKVIESAPEEMKQTPLWGQAMVDIESMVVEAESGLSEYKLKLERDKLKKGFIILDGGIGSQNKIVNR